MCGSTGGASGVRGIWERVLLDIDIGENRVSDGCGGGRGLTEGGLGMQLIFGAGPNDELYYTRYVLLSFRANDVEPRTVSS
jgi:hypothetical protein